MPLTATAAYDVAEPGCEPEVAAGTRLNVCGGTDDDADEEGSSTIACAGAGAVVIHLANRRRSSRSLIGRLSTLIMASSKIRIRKKETL